MIQKIFLEGLKNALLWAGEIVQSVKYLVCKYEGVGGVGEHHKFKASQGCKSK